jgi:hypothetical protein
MIADFVPAKSGLASGIVIKQSILERNKYPQPQVDTNSTIAYASSGSQNNIPLVFQDISVSGTVAPQWNDYQPGTIENFSGGTGGSFEPFNGVNTSPYGPNGTGPQNIFGITQSWYETTITPSGSILVLHDTQDEFYDGEFSGSVLVVTTQSLAQAYPLDNLSFDYTPVLYSPQNYDLDQSSTIAQSQFLNSLTIPNQGEILMLRPTRTQLTTNTGIVQVIGPSFIKIHKFDNNGINNTFPLSQITQLLIQYSTLSNYSIMSILTINEYPSYYLYEVNNLGTAAANLDNYILDYSVSASNAGLFTIPPSSSNPQTLVVYGSTTGNTTGYFNSTTGIYSLENTPNVTLYITGSMLASGTGGGKFDLVLNRQGTLTSIVRKDFTAGVTSTITASLYGLDGDEFYLSTFRTSSGTSTLVSGSFLITQSISPSAKEFDPIIIEPYITEPNYYNSDYNPLINNVLVDRLSSIYQDVDYSTGMVTPTNFDLLISGSALKAAVQDSNYTSKRVILPRYEGSKSTSQHLNYWTPDDTGTYGKLPTIESLKTMVAYCDDIGGWPPERENASAAFVKYLIKSDGSVVIPNTTPNSLVDNQETFETEENVLVQFTGTGNQASPIRKVIRGGTRIEPVLYNQSGSMPGGTFISSITLTDNGVTGSVISDFQAKLRPTSYTLNLLSISPSTTEICLNQILSTGSGASLSTLTLSGTTSYRYKVNSNTISEGVSLTLSAHLEATYIGGYPLSSGNTNIYYGYSIVRWRGGSQTVLASTLTTQISSPYTALDLSVTVPFNDLQLNDEFAIIASSTEDSVYVESTSRFNINQSPAPNSSIPIISNFWISSSGLATSLIQAQTSGAFGDNLLVMSSSLALINYYGNPTVFQQDIAGSGFNPIVTPWSIEYGDEFRFEGREDRIYEVKQAAIVNLNILSSQIPFLVVEFNQPVPTSGSVNFNQFLIRRYVDDASQIIMEGFKPINSSGPYIVRPEFTTPELNKSVDQIILDLTQKGLIT